MFESVTSVTSVQDRERYSLLFQKIFYSRKVVVMAHGMTGCVHHMSQYLV